MCHRVSTGQLLREILGFPCFHTLGQHTSLFLSTDISRGVVGFTIVVERVRFILINRNIERKCCNVSFCSDQIHDRLILYKDSRR